MLMVALCMYWAHMQTQILGTHADTDTNTGTHAGTQATALSYSDCAADCKHPHGGAY